MVTFGWEFGRKPTQKYYKKRKINKEKRRKDTGQQGTMQESSRRKRTVPFLDEGEDTAGGKEKRVISVLVGEVAVCGR